MLTPIPKHFITHQKKKKPLNYVDYKLLKTWFLSQKIKKKFKISKDLPINKPRSISLQEYTHGNITSKTWFLKSQHNYLNTHTREITCIKSHICFKLINYLQPNCVDCAVVHKSLQHVLWCYHRRCHLVRSCLGILKLSSLRLSGFRWI